MVLIRYSHWILSIGRHATDGMANPFMAPLLPYYRPRCSVEGYWFLWILR